MKLMSYFLNFVKALREQLEKDNKRWGDEWKQRPIGAKGKWAHQNDRVYERFDVYYEDWNEDGIPIPWLKICGNAFIAWVREYDPEHYHE